MIVLLFFSFFSLFSREGLTFSTNYNGKRQKLLFQVLQWMRQVLQKDCQVRGTLLLRLSRRVLRLHTPQGHHQPRTRPARPARGPNHLQRTDPHIIPCGLSVPRRFLKQCRSRCALALVHFPEAVDGYFLRSHGCPRTQPLCPSSRRS